MGWGHLGFSYVGAAFLVALVVPNVLWARGRKADDEAAGRHEPAPRENPVLRAFEGAGQALTVGAALAFADTNPGPAWSRWTWWLVGAAALMTAYEAAWVRYFRSARTPADLYRSLVGIPLPLATLPVAAFALLGVYGRLWPLLIAAAVLGVGHVGIHLGHRRALGLERDGAEVR